MLPGNSVVRVPCCAAEIVDVEDDVGVPDVDEFVRMEDTEEHDEDADVICTVGVLAWTSACELCCCSGAFTLTVISLARHFSGVPRKGKAPRGKTNLDREKLT